LRKSFFIQLFYHLISLSAEGEISKSEAASDLLRFQLAFSMASICSQAAEDSSSSRLKAKLELQVFITDF
jgi:negative regulator of replication initiation